MKQALIWKHVGFEDLGTLEPVLEKAGYAIEEREVTQQDPAAGALEVDLLVALGGPLGVYQEEAYPFLGVEKAVLRERLNQRRPTLGICLGSQLMAAALGVEVVPGGAKEIGWLPIELTEAGSSSPLRHLNGVEVMHWHGDTFALPEGASHLACSALFEQQAFSVGDSILALQFHPEVTVRGLERWYVGHCGELHAEAIAVPELRAASAQKGPQLEQAGAKLFAEWLEGLNAARPET